MHTSRCTAPDYNVHYVKSVIHSSPSKESLKHSFSRPGAGWVEKLGGVAGFRRCLLTPHTFSRFMKPLCDLCGSRHESYQAHVFASNNRTASNTNASNKGVAGASSRREKAGAWHEANRRDGPSCDENLADVEQGDLRNSKHKKQRWTREAYNAYQREYMRRRRALARGH